MRKHLKRSTFLSILALSLSGCADRDMHDLNEYINTVKFRPPTPIEPIPKQKDVDNVAFDSKTNEYRDPFKIKEIPIEKIPTLNNGISPDITRVKEDLESYPLDSLTVSGTVTLNDKIWAIIKEKSGGIFRVKVGDHIGENYGEIIEITQQDMQVLEIFPDKNPGSWYKQEITLNLDDNNK